MHPSPVAERYRRTMTPSPLLSSLGVDLPLVGAPMAGGPGSPALVAALAAGGALPVVAGGYLAPGALAERVTAARATGHPFGVNLFVPGPPDFDRDAFARYAERLAPEAEQLGISLDPAPRVDDDAYPAKLALLLDDPVPLVSFTFAPPTASDVAALQRAGSRVLVTVTTPEEAREAEARGADGLVVQGPRAGGHSGTWDPGRRIGEEDTAAVVRAVRAQTRLPLVAAGGVDGPAAVTTLRESGAEAVAVGTLLLRAEEAGTSATHRDALADPRFTATAVTRAFTGRPARALRTPFLQRHDAEAPTAYPAVHHLTRALRAEASRRGLAELVHLWAGTGFRAARAVSARTVIDDLAGDL